VHLRRLFRRQIAAVHPPHLICTCVHIWYGTVKCDPRAARGDLVLAARVPDQRRAYGQEKDCLIFNFVAQNTREGRAFRIVIPAGRQSGASYR
jgi:hypothetical protein